MKKSTLVLAITAAVTALPALAFEPGGSIVSGDRPTDLHTFNADGSITSSAVAIGLETDTSFTIDRAQFDNAPGTLTKLSGAAPVGEILVTRNSIWLPNFPAAFGGPMELTNGTGEEPTSYELTTNSAGKIVDGFYGSESVSPSTGNDLYAFYDFTTRSIVTFDGCTAAATITDARDYNNNLTIPAGCTVVQHGVVTYKTCDTTEECGQLSKSVPVPALATAGLALGLAGITYLTSRRRSVK